MRESSSRLMVGAMLTLAEQSLRQVRRPYPLPVGFRESKEHEIFLQVWPHPPARKRAVKKIASALTFEDRHELLRVLLEPAQDGIGDLAVHLGVPFAGKGEGVWRFRRAGLAEQAAEDVAPETVRTTVAPCQSLTASEPLRRLTQIWIPQSLTHLVR